MKINRMLLVFFLLLVASAVLLNGCGSKKGDPIVTINDNKLYLDDFLYEIYLVESEGNQLDEYYQKNLGYGYWDYEYLGFTMRETAKSSVLTRVVMYEILSDQAKKKGITLTEKEVNKNREEIDAFLTSNTEAALTDIGLTREVLAIAFHKISLSDKYYTELSQDFEIDEIALKHNLNKEDYREYQTECLFIPTVKTANQTLTPLSEEQVNEAFETISEVLQKLKNGTSFDSLRKSNDPLTYYSRNFINSERIFEEEYQAVAITLANGEYSDIITTNYGYYILHMLDNDSLSRYEQAVKEAVDQEKDKQFAVIYNKIKDQYDITIHFEYWDPINLGSITTSNAN